MTDCANLTAFEKAFEVCSMAIYYTSKESFQKMGIVLDKEAALSAPLPQGWSGFCQPPKGVR